MITTFTSLIISKQKINIKGDKMIKISTSILSSKNRQESIIKLNNSNTDYLHIDVMDGKFVPNYQFSIEEINNILPLSEKKIDIHLMVENPEKYLEKINHSNNIEFITIHIEINNNIKDIINIIKNKGYKVGIAIKPNTNINTLKPYINDIDLILIMSVEPGFGGQEFIENTINRINNIKQLKKDIIIEVDGGINNNTINLIKENIDIAVVGSYIIKQENYNKAINILKN